MNLAYVYNQALILYAMLPVYKLLRTNQVVAGEDPVDIAGDFILSLDIGIQAGVYYLICRMQLTLYKIA